MSQCVPSWDLDENFNTPTLNLQAHHVDSSKSNLLPRVPSLDYEVAELTWENGQLAMHGLGPARVPHAKFPPWERPRAGGTLESIVNQATRGLDGKRDHHHKEMMAMGQWSDGSGGDSVNPASTAASLTVTVDALVPCNKSKSVRGKDKPEASAAHALDSVPGVMGSSTRVGSCSGTASPASRRRVARAGISSESESESATCGWSEGHQVTVDTCERELGGAGLTSTSLFSPENTFFGKEYTKNSVDEHDSVCHGRSLASSERETRDEAPNNNNKHLGKSSVSTKRSRAAAIHNQSERKRRDRINERMNMLQKLVPNSSKTDKASMLDEVIEYLKQLQAQINLMSRMNMSPMMIPLAMQQQFQMSMMNPLAMAMGMGMGINIMDMNTLGRAAAAATMPPAIPPPTIPPTAAFIPVPSWDNSRDRTGSLMPDPLSIFLACQSQPMTMEAYNRLAALYQHFQQQPGGFGSSSKN